MKTIRVFEAFAGYGSQAMALKRLQRDFPDRVEFEFVGISEIEPYAIAAYNAVHGDTPNFGDISTIDWAQVSDFDLFTYSFPCQDISTAGKQKGFIEGSGSRSSLLWECRRAIEAKRPKFLLMENVKALVQKKFMPEFQRWIDTLAALGYVSFWQVLNAKDYGIPQNRERVFMVSILGGATFEFPKPFPLEKRLRDVLEENVDEQYYLSDAQTQRILAHCERKVAE
uniref:DNA (cytosine-5-)-methyltransferase n=1 Tax=Xylanibacter muris TaxID=2736290 RepID=UPI0025A16F63